VSTRSIETEFLHIDKTLCIACGKCVEECPNYLLKIVGFNFKIFKHQHVKIVKPEDCTGCFSCVEICPDGAIKEKSD